MLDIKNKRVVTVLQIIIAVVFIVFVGALIQADYLEMRDAEDSYSYCSALCTLTSTIGMFVLWAFYLVEARLLFVKKCYTKLPIYLIYAFGLCTLGYLYGADRVFHHVVDVIDKDEYHYLSTFAIRLYSGVKLPILLAFFLIPRLIERVRELKEEQELTI